LNRDSLNSGSRRSRSAGRAGSVAGAMRTVPRTAKLETARADSTRRVRPLWSALPNRTPGASGAP